jgi:hypothetical protein
MSDRRQLKQETRAVLTGLGTNADEVARSLASAGINGVPKNNRSCAVALYLNALIGADKRVQSIKVGHCSLFIDLASASGTRPAGRLQVQLPKPVRQFVAAFDAHSYPAVTRLPGGALLPSECQATGAASS